MADGEVAQGTSPEVWDPNGSAEVAFSERRLVKEGGVADRQSEGAGKGQDTRKRWRQIIQT